MKSDRSALVDGLRSARKKMRGALLAGVAAGVFPSQGSLAQDARIDDVKVSGGSGENSRRKTEVLKISRPIVVVDPKTAEREHIERLEDFAKKVPNYRPNIGNPRTSRPAIRGVSRGAGTGDGSEFDTGFVVDNVFWKHVGFQWADFIDIESFEVALGPRGTDGGKNTTVGAVVVRTQLPSFERKATFETSFANNSRFIEKLNVTGPVIDDTLAYRISAYVDKGDGWFRDQATGASYLDNNRWGARGQLLYVGDNVTDRLIFNYSASNEYNNNDSGPFRDSFQVFGNGFAPPSYAQTFYKRLGRRVLTFDPYRPFNVRNGVLDERQHSVSNELDVNIGENTLTAISAYGKFRLLPRNATGNQLADISGGASDTYVEQFSQEFRYASPKDQPLEWVGGLFAFYEYVWNRSHTDFGADAAAWFPKNDKPRTALLNGLQNNRDGKARDFQIAAYGQATYHFDEQLALTIGLRNSYEIKEGSNFSWSQLYPLSSPSMAEQIEAIDAGGGQRFYDTGGHSKYLNAITGIFNPQYKINENILVYGLVGRGEKAGAVNTGAQGIFVNGVFKKFQPVVTDPEVSWDYEIGAKTNWFDNTVILNVNLYWNDLYNFQTNFTDTSVVDANGVPVRQNFLGNAAHVRLRGLEFDGRWNPLERLWINFSGAYTEARWIDFKNAPPPADWTWNKNQRVAPLDLASPLTVDRSNMRWENLPIWAFNVGFNYEQPLGAVFADFHQADWAREPVSGFVYANLAWQDKAQLTDPYAVFAYWQKAYAIVDFGFGLKTDNERYALEFWAKNIFDERPVTSWSPGSQTTPATLGLPKAPRTFGGSLRVKLY